MTEIASDNVPKKSLDVGLATWIAVLMFVYACLALRGMAPWLSAYPREWVLPIAPAIDHFSTAAAEFLKPAFRSMATVLSWPMRFIQMVLQWMPWPVTLILVGLTALRAGGRSLAIFASATMVYLLVAGYWRESMNTLALVVLAVPVSVACGFAIGILAHRVPRVRNIIEVALDVMQTMPAFAYLIPLLLLFGFGPVVGLIASALYAIPPMVRNTMLGIEQVPREIRESGVMNGGTSRQIFWLVEVPTAMPQLLVGINQCTMAAFSAVIIASIIGGFEDIGWEVLTALRMAAFGQSLLSGLVIALLAMMIDRITLGFATQRSTGRSRKLWPIWLNWGSFWMIFGLLLLVAVVMHLTGLNEQLSFVGSVRLIDAESLNAWVLGLVSRYADPLEAFKNNVLYFLIMPIRIGMVEAVMPMSWGFELTPTVVAIYVTIIALVAVALGGRFGWRASLAVVVAGTLFYFGFSAFPWPAFIALVVILAWRCAGPGTATFSLLSCLFILMLGLWAPFMQTVYLCGLAVLLCAFFGGLIGLWAAGNETVSRVVRPINDTLQTMPQFVFLIPALMFFKVGEFTALIAIMLYVIVPPIRYVEHGIRQVRVDCIEAGNQCGCTPLQLLFHVKLPLAIPVIMLGLNQTIMAALSMVVIAAMVGTKDLGQQVYFALSKASAGLGLTSGVAISLVAMVADRIIRGWVTNHRAKYASAILEQPKRSDA